MSEKPVLYRKRLIPSECIRLDSDEILQRSDRLLVTRWKTIRPKKNLKSRSLLLSSERRLENKPFSRSRRPAHLLVLRYYRLYLRCGGRFLCIHGSAGRRSSLSFRRNPRRRSGRGGRGSGIRSAFCLSDLFLYAEAGLPASGDLCGTAAAFPGKILAAINNIIKISSRLNILTRSGGRLYLFLPQQAKHACIRQGIN